MVYKLEINGWSAGITFSACHMVPEINKCSRLHGHTYAVHARIYGEKAEKGMVLDFGIVKETLKKIIDKLDHKVLLPKAKVKKENKKIKIVEGKKEYNFPIEDVMMLELKSITAENLVAYLLEEFTKELQLKQKKNISEVALGLDEGWGQGVWLRKKL
ncbi:MAG: 6-carboxytetrahydropterin synthase [Candidatus Thermoplasmatota archaeon]